MLQHLFTVMQQLGLFLLILLRIPHAIAGTRKGFSDDFASADRHHQLRAKPQRFSPLLAKHKRTGGRIGLPPA